jgi:rhamnogalacturonan acetylesterase
MDADDTGTLIRSPPDAHQPPPRYPQCLLLESGDGIMFMFRHRRLTLIYRLLVSLALPFLGSAVHAAEGDRPTLFIVGDSTVRNGTPGQQGWGDPLIKLFDSAKIKVENHAIGGRSSRTFQTEGRWDKILAAAKAGDFVLIQMGHNDGGAVNDNSRARGSIRGIGEGTQEIDNLLTKKHEIVHTYGWYLRKYIADARAKGMTPILVSPIPHCPQKPVEKGTREASRYVDWSEQVAQAEKCLFLDLNRLIMGRYAGLDPADIKAKYFTSADNTHTSPAGAEFNAAAVADGIRGLKDCPLANYLLPEAASASSRQP